MVSLCSFSFFLAGRVHCGSGPIRAFCCDPFLRLPRWLHPFPHYQPYQGQGCGVPPKVSGLMGDIAEGTWPVIIILIIIMISGHVHQAKKQWWVVYHSMCCVSDILWNYCGTVTISCPTDTLPDQQRAQAGYLFLSLCWTLDWLHTGVGETRPRGCPMSCLTSPSPWRRTGTTEPKAQETPGIRQLHTGRLRVPRTRTRGWGEERGKWLEPWKSTECHRYQTI